MIENSAVIEQPAVAEDNSHAGQGPVVLDIGGDIGALIISVPAELAGVEIEARPVAGPALRRLDTSAVEHHHHGGEPHSHAHPSALPHVAVLGRPVDGCLQFGAVFGELLEGDWELYLRPDGPVRLSVTVRGGEVSTADWPA